MRTLVGADDGREHRQVGVVDAHGRAATYTGSECLDWAGGTTGPGYAAQGNILVSAATVEALAAAFDGSAGRPLAERLLGCLAAAEAAGGDRRGRQSAALLVVRKDGGYGGTSDVAVDLRVDDHPEPIAELERIYLLHDLLFGQTPDEEWLDVDAALAAELGERLAALGYEGRAAGRPRRLGRHREPRGAGARRRQDRPGRPPRAARAVGALPSSGDAGGSPAGDRARARGRGGGRAPGHAARAVLRPRLRLRPHAGDRLHLGRPHLGRDRAGDVDPLRALVRLGRVRLAHERDRPERGLRQARRVRRDGGDVRRRPRRAAGVRRGRRALRALLLRRAADAHRPLRGGDTARRRAAGGVPARANGDSGAGAADRRRLPRRGAPRSPAGSWRS